jgi:5-formyltetrahydrofolate cyclo-ligase
VLRREVSAKRDALHNKFANSSSQRLAEIFFNTKQIRELIKPESIVGGYSPINSEIDCLPVLEQLFKLGIAICLPVVSNKEKHLTFYQWKPGDKMVRGSYGVCEPLTSNKEIIPNVLLVPMLACDKHGNRLGYGGGYYDRTLKKLRARKSMGGVTAIGLAYEGQIYGEIPHFEEDEPIDIILTDVGAIVIS